MIFHFTFFIPDITEITTTTSHWTIIIVGTVVGGVVIVLSALVIICCVCQAVVEKEKTKWDTQKKVSLKKLQSHIHFIKKALPQLSDFETRQCFLDFLHEIREGLKDKTIEPEFIQDVIKVVGGNHTTAV